MIHGGRPGLPDDGDRALGVLQHRLADRTQQHPGQATAAARPDDHQLRVAGALRQRVRGPVLQEDGFDAQFRVLLTPADELLGQQALLTPDLLVPVRRSGHHVRHRRVQPGTHRTQRDSACDRRLHGEGQRRLALRRSVQPDDDRAVLARGVGPADDDDPEQAAWAASAVPTDPMTSPANPPKPR